MLKAVLHLNLPRILWSVRFHVLTATIMEMTLSGMLLRVIWRILTGVSEQLTASIISDGNSSAETSVNIYQTTQCNILEDSHLNPLRVLWIITSKLSVHVENGKRSVRTVVFIHKIDYSTLSLKIEALCSSERLAHCERVLHGATTRKTVLDAGYSKLGCAILWRMLTAVHKDTEILQRYSGIDAFLNRTVTSEVTWVNFEPEIKRRCMEWYQQILEKCSFGMHTNSEGVHHTASYTHTF
jgi:hypothetical protein